MLGVLVLVCAYFSWATWKEQVLGGRAAANELAASLPAAVRPGASIFIAARAGVDAARFAEALERLAEGAGYRVSGIVAGEPSELSRAREARAGDGLMVDAFATTSDYRGVVETIRTRIPAVAERPVLAPADVRWPTFLLADNLLNVANQIVVYAVVAIGGGFGTLSEIALALRAGRVVVALGSWELDPERRGDAPYLRAATPVEAIGLVEQALALPRPGAQLHGA